MIRVLFACVHNAGRSPMAAAWFNTMADPAKACAVSAGTEPGPRVHPEVVAVMKEAGIDLSKAKPRRLTPRLARGTRLFVTMGCGERCPFVPGLEVLDWPIEDPKGRPVARVREICAEVASRVEALVSLRGWGKATPTAGRRRGGRGGS